MKVHIMYRHIMLRHIRSIAPLAAALVLSAASFVTHAQVRVLVYGDSNTWGWKPTKEGNPTPRYSDTERWPGVMQSGLGQKYTVEVNGLIARTLGVDLPEGLGALSGQDHNGRRRLDLALMQAAPVHFTVIMLGTNDMIDGLKQSPAQVAKGLEALVKKAKAGTASQGVANAPKMLFVIPPPLGETKGGPFESSFSPRAIQKSRVLPDAIKKEAARLGMPVLDAGQLVTIEGVDGVHLTPAAHETLGKAVAAEVAKLLAP